MSLQVPYLRALFAGLYACTTRNCTPNNSIDCSNGSRATGDNFEGRSRDRFDQDA
jgi:hypothetical protein